MTATTNLTLLLGWTFVLLGGINVWLVLEAWSRVKSAGVSRRMLNLHRIGGYAFITLFCVMTYFMIARLRGGADTSPTVTLHIALALMLSPLLFIKIMIARYYKNQHNLLMPVGLAIFILTFVLIAGATAPYLARPVRMERVTVPAKDSLPGVIDLNEAVDLMQRRCSKCHTLDRVVAARKDADGWVATVNRMRGLPGAQISESDGRTIASYLISQNSTAGVAAERALVDQKCGRCHALDRVYKTVQSAEEWNATVARMVDLASGSAGAVQPNEQRRILDYLISTQTPEARQRKASTTAAAAPASPAEKKVESLEPTSSWKGFTFLALVFVGATVLAVRRPEQRKAAAPAVVPTPARGPEPKAATGPFLLRLIQITPQTADAKTLRFAVQGDRKLDALPGQFLTFSFLFDGRKEARCYSICSSPAHAAYVEITPKRMERGCVSVFLNDQAAIGLTVEATGPFGRFSPDFAQEREIVLLAAGSGITPMMAMLRHIDDLCLDTDVTLLYFVRTSRDIIFQAALEELAARLKNFRYRVVSSQPEPGWTGASGRINREFVASAVPELGRRVFFLCGPPPFMDAARSILQDLGVVPARIRQEVFGGAGAAPAKPAEPPASTGHKVEFARSGKSIVPAEGQTLLEAAAEAGVEIPSACRQGQCGTCKTRLLDGEVRMAAQDGLDADSRARGFVLTCVGRAAGNVRLDA